MDDCWYHVCALQQTCLFSPFVQTAPPQRLAGDERAWLCMPICLCTRLCKQIGMHSSSREALSALQARAVRGALVVLFIDAMCVFLGGTYYIQKMGMMSMPMDPMWNKCKVFSMPSFPLSAL